MTDKQIVTTTIRLEKTDRAHKNAFFTALQKQMEEFRKEEEMMEEFSKWVQEKGYTTPKDFLMVGEFVRNPNKRRPRTIITDEIRKGVIEDVEAKVLKTFEIAEKHHITEASVYNIKHHAGLTKKRGTPSETTKDQSSSETPSETEKSPSPLAA